MEDQTKEGKRRPSTKKAPGCSAEGPMHPGYFLPASAVSEQGTRAAKSSCLPSRLLLFASAQELVPFDRRHHSNRAFFALFGALHTAQETHFHRAGQCNFVRKRQQNLDGRSFLHVLRQEEVTPTRADVAGFGTGFANCCPGSPTHGKRQPHGKPLGRAAL